MRSDCLVNLFRELPGRMEVFLAVEEGGVGFDTFKKEERAEARPSSVSLGDLFILSSGISLFNFPSNIYQN